MLPPIEERVDHDPSMGIYTKVPPAQRCLGGNIEEAKLGRFDGGQGRRAVESGSEDCGIEIGIQLNFC